jgi:phosphoglucosamine mutase
VVAKGADLGLAFDGDADRLIAVDENGVKITGDKILAICASHAKNQGRLKNNLVVSTVMSNIGLSMALKTLGIDHLKAGVGDREVLKEMRETGAVMGGEDSGHMIFSDFHTTGDGILSALRLIRVMADTGKSLSELATVMTVYPQILMNVEVDASRPDFMKIKTIAHEIETVEQALKDTGRVLVRYSGTQPLLRVMVEGPDPQITEAHCLRICDAIKIAKI